MPFYIVHRSSGFYWAGLTRGGLDSWTNSVAHAAAFLDRDDAERQSFDLEADLHAVDVVASEQRDDRGVFA